MASTPFTLAALATSAVAGLQVNGTRPHTSGSGGEFASAVLSTERGEVIVRVPTTAAAEVQQSGELLGRAALAEGARARLPFQIPVTLGMTRAGDFRAVVSTFLAGTVASDEGLASNAEVLKSLAQALAAIHELPVSVVQQGGLPMRSASDVRTLSARLVQRAADTGLLPATVRQRWQEALDSESLWSFEPVVIHGSLASEQLFTKGDEITGVLGWNELSLGDPALDLAWMFGIDRDVFETVLARYGILRDLSGQQEFTSRARFHHELKIVQWLLHGIETHDQSIIDDAVQMFDRLVDNLGLLGTPLPKRAPLSADQVALMLNDTPPVLEDQRTETAEYEALEEERAFDVDPDDDTDTGTDPATDASIDPPTYPGLDSDATVRE